MLDGDFGAIQDKLESGASAGGGEIEPYMISLAISAKRIADMLAPPMIRLSDEERGRIARELAENPQRMVIARCSPLAPPEGPIYWSAAEVNRLQAAFRGEGHVRKVADEVVAILRERAAQ